jgi:shikimate kinase
MTPEKPLVVLVGPPAAGKTRVGKRVARLLGVDFIDTDAEITRVHGSPSEIFAEHGESFFRGVEREAVVSALKSSGVVALGGGAVVSPETRVDLHDHNVAMITISADAVAHRLDPERRPLLAAGLPAWEELVRTRAPFYEEVATESFDTSHRPLDTVAQEVADWVRGRGQA